MCNSRDFITQKEVHQAADALLNFISVEKMLKIYSVDEKGNRFEITDLYWFEEQGVHSFDGEGFHEKYRFEVYVDGIKVYPPNTAKTS